MSESGRARGAMKEMAMAEEGRRPKSGAARTMAAAARSAGAGRERGGSRLLSRCPLPAEKTNKYSFCGLAPGPAPPIFPRPALTVAARARARLAARVPGVRRGQVGTGAGRTGPGCRVAGPVVPTWRASWQALLTAYSSPSNSLLNPNLVKPRDPFLYQTPLTHMHKAL